MIKPRTRRHTQLVLSWFVVCCLLTCRSFAQDATSTDPPDDSDSVAVPDNATTSTPAANAPGGAQGNGSVTNGYTFPTSEERKRYWVRVVTGPQVFLRAGFRASWATWTDSPEEWEQNFSGWSKRFGAALMGNSIIQTSTVLVSAATHQDPKYYHCSCTGFWPKVGHGIKLSFTGRNHSGNPVFSPAKVISPFVGPLVTRNTIYPDRYNSADAIRGGALNVLGYVGWNVLREVISKRKNP